MLVFAYDEKTGEQAYKKVVRVFRNKTDKWYHIHVNGEEIICTPLHPFYVVGVGFKHAKDLRLTDLLLTAQGKCAKIQSIEVESLDAPETTYNLEVEDFHTYYVSDNNILVHNACSSGKVFNDDQKALIDIIKGNGKNQPLSFDDARTLLKWGEEYNLSIRIDMGHSIGTAVSRAPHLHTGFNNWHIPIIPE